MAPELAGRRDYTYMVDFYSLGAVAFELVAGRTPFVCKSINIGEFEENVQKKEPVIPAKFSPEFKDFLTKLLEKDPVKRLGSVNGADEILAHPWLADIDFERLAAKEIQPPLQVDMNNLNLVLSDIDMQKECEIDEDDPTVGRGVRILSQFSFSEDIVKSPQSVSDQTEETNDEVSEQETASNESGELELSLTTIGSKRLDIPNSKQETLNSLLLSEKRDRTLKAESMGALIDPQGDGDSN